MVSFEIKFNKSDKKYRNGDVITIFIRIDVDEIFRAHSLWVRFKGAAHTEWVGKRTNKIWWQNFSADETFMGDQLYFESEKYLERFTDGARDYVETGVHEYTTSYTLPDNLPPK